MEKLEKNREQRKLSSQIQADEYTVFFFFLQKWNQNTVYSNKIRNVAISLCKNSVKYSELLAQPPTSTRTHTIAHTHTCIY